MRRRLSYDDVKRFIERLQASVEREECASCECLQGALTQLEVDAGGAGIGGLIEPLKVSRAGMHG